MKRVAMSLLCTASLSGCALPVGVTVASWAADGISLLATEKSLLDHGISYVSGEDCALWRMFTDDEVCEDTDTDIAVADAGRPIAAAFAGSVQPSGGGLGDYLSLTASAPVSEKAQNAGSLEIASIDHAQDYGLATRTPWYRQNRNDEYLALMPAGFSSGLVKEPVAVAAAPGARVHDGAVSRLVDAAGSDVAAIPSGLGPAPSIEIEFDERSFERPVAAPVKPVVRGMPTVLAGDADDYADPGRYFVIGSFGVWGNATRFAARHHALEAQIHGAVVDGDDVFRIVVGPFEASERTALAATIADAGIKSTWTMHVADGDRTVAWTGDGEQLASLGAPVDG